HTPLPVRRERNFPKKEEPIVLELSTAENGRDKSDSTEEVPVQKVKTAIRGLRNKAYGVLSHVPSRRADIEGAITIPRGFLEFQAAAHLPQTDADIVVYCASGARSLLAPQVLRAMGYTQVASMAGGITRWQAAGYPVVRDRHLSAEQLERY